MKIVKTANGQKLTLSKSEWENLGKQAGWMKMANLISNCCSAVDKMMGEDGQTYAEAGLCPKCGEHCEFIDEDSDED